MKLLYDWHDNPNIDIFLMNIYFNSENVMKNNSKYANELINDIEEYLMYLINNHYNIDIIMQKLNKLLYISTFDNKPIIDNGITYLYQEPVITRDKYILLNNGIKGDNKLTTKERRKLYLYKGLSQFIFNYDNDMTEEFSNVYGNDSDKKIANNGWKLITDTLAQELAEKITYDTIKKERPNKRVGIEENDYLNINGSLVVSRLECERPFEELIVFFGTTLSNVGNIFDYSHNKIMDDLIKKALNSDLSNQIISEYIYKGNGKELYNLLYLMGLLVNEKYASYGKRIIKNISINQAEANNIYNTIIEECNKLFTLDEDIYEDVPICKNIKRLRNQ